MTLALQLGSVEAIMTRTADGLFENPNSVDDVVRDLEDSGYPVDGLTGEFIRHLDDPSAGNRQNRRRSGATRQRAEKMRAPERKETDKRLRSVRQGNAAHAGAKPRAILGRL